MEAAKAALQREQPARRAAVDEAARLKAEMDAVNTDLARTQSELAAREHETAAAGVGRVALAGMLLGVAGAAVAGVNEIVKRAGTEAETVAAPETWSKMSGMAPLMEHIVFDKYSADEATIRTPDMRRIVERLFGVRSAQDMQRHRIGDTDIVTKAEFMDWMLRAEHVPEDQPSMDVLKRRVSEVPDWTICTYEVVGATRARTTQDTQKGTVLGMLNVGERVEVLQIRDVPDGRGGSRQRLRFKWQLSSPLETMSGSEAWVSATASNGDHLLVRKEDAAGVVDVAGMGAAPPVRDAWTLEQESDKSGQAALKLTTSQAHRLGTLYQNQRKRVGIFASAEFTSENLLKVERLEWSDAEGEPRELGQLPPGMVWEIDR